MKRKPDKTAKKRHNGFRGPSPDVGKATQFQTGNPGGGRPKKRALDILIEEAVSANDGRVGQQITTALVKKAKRGDVKAIQLIAERTQGRPKQALELSGRDGGPIGIADFSGEQVDKRFAAILSELILEPSCQMGRNAIETVIRALETTSWLK